MIQVGHVPKGLATVAFLKTRLDEGCDHLGLFEPLVLDALAHVASPDFLAEDIREVVNNRAGIVLPQNAVQTLLGRCARRDYLERKGGRFFRTAKPVAVGDFQENLGAIQLEQERLGQALIQFARAHGIVIDSQADALEALSTFISNFKVQIMLGDSFTDSPLDRSPLGRKPTRMVARFIVESCLPSPTLKPAFAALTEGILLEDTLLMRDIPNASERFHNLVVAFDTGILFAAIDLAGSANAVAAKESLRLLREAGARTVAFDRTLMEMRTILAVYESKLGTLDGRMSLYPTPLTHHVLTERLSPADIRVISITLEQRLEKIGVHVIPVPPHEPQYTSDEGTLATSLVDETRPDNTDTPRIRHDVDCVAGILTLRRGQTGTSIERCVAIFCSDSGRVVRNVQQWYVREGYNGIPPIVHPAALTSIAWLKRPLVVPEVKMHEFAAICLAVMRPARTTWQKFIQTLSQMREDGIITDDETAAIVASDLMEPKLASLEQEFEPDSDSIHEAIERVRESYRAEAVAHARQAVDQALAESKTKEQLAEDAIRTAKGEAEEAQRIAMEALRKRDALQSSIEDRIGLMSERLSGIVFSLGVVIVVVAGILSVLGLFYTFAGALAWVARAIVGVTTAFGVYRTIYGKSLKLLRAELREVIAGQLRKRWLSNAGELELGQRKIG